MDDRDVVADAPAGDRTAFGRLIQAYARISWGEPTADDEVARLEAALDPELRARIDALGSDIKALLAVEPAAAPDKLQALERQAQAEDARAQPKVERQRAREERAIDDPGAAHAHHNRGRQSDGQRRTTRQPRGRKPGGRSN